MVPKPFLALAFLTVACWGCSSSGNVSGSVPAAPQNALSLGDTPATGNPVGKYIKHVVVIIQENRSLENFFAGYPGADAPMYGYGRNLRGRRIKIPLHEITFENGPNLAHLWQAAITDWDNGKMDGFSAYGQRHDYAGYSYLERSQIKPYWTMAQQYVLADHMFPTEFGPSYTAHLTLVAGTDSLSRSRAEVNFPSAHPNDCDSPPGTRSSTVDKKRQVDTDTGPFPCFTQFLSMANTLDAAKISWKYYVTKVLNAGIWSPFEAIKYVRDGPDWNTDIIAPQTRILTDPGAGQLADVSWVTPSHPDSDHPGAHSPLGPSWVTSIVNAIGESSYWNSTAIVILWDDWGGFYDNAPPPQLDFRGLGIRVPCLIISPYAKQGYVSHTSYEFGSILKFIEEAYNLPNLGLTRDGYTDKRANSIEDSFDFTQSPRPFKPIKAPVGANYFRSEAPSNEPVDEE
jgi:phospholipase C